LIANGDGPWERDRPPTQSCFEGIMDNRVQVWGLPFAPMTRAQAVEAVVNLVELGQPSYFITANAHYAMLSHAEPGLRAINERAAFVLADGAPLVWASRWKGTPVPERVAGSDLIFDLCQRAARDGYRIFFLGGEAGVAEQAAEALSGRYPGLRIVGTECPPFRELSPEEHAAMLDRIRAARPDLLFVAFGQPKGEYWIAKHFRALAVPVCVQVGASLDFAAGRIPRAPRRLQKLGLEWAYRMWLEPSRLAPRYARNAWFLLNAVARDLVRGVGGRLPLPGLRSRAIPPLRRQPGRGD
jgi:N-acetylglucosaminyldiphosphoundecaprenol N-acetyl-beta-D-mannosaminyltransferase